ncbi:MAG: tetratricopeptide repeat protein [Melioribacteraceae bacterium]|nr:tetratricopeptide repeat protein [Melioribacteraceae bacterium]
MKKLVLVMTLFLLLFTACSTENEKDLIEKGTQQLQEKNYAEAVKTYEELVQNFPGKEEAGYAYLEMAKLYQGRALKNVTERNSYLKAIEYYKKVYNDYSQMEEAPGAMFMTGFLQANEINDIEAANETYTVYFLENYPDHELAPSRTI